MPSGRFRGVGNVQLLVGHRGERIRRAVVDILNTETVQIAAQLRGPDRRQELAARLRGGALRTIVGIALAPWLRLNRRGTPGDSG
jgi:hypothetical protein